jgi:NAD+ kinase
MNIGIHGKEFGRDTIDFIRYVLDRVVSKHQVKLSAIFKSFISEGLPEHKHLPVYSSESVKELDVIITLGGDGTLLEAVTQIGALGTPILGVNTGRLGFLATTAKEDFDGAIQNLENGNYEYDERTLLKLDADPPLFNGLNFALNDVAILKKDTSSMITVHASINDEFLNSYWADGIIISTPTGSTGYSISCGGPVVVPGSNNFVITPVSPHNLTVRPIVVPDTSVLSFSIEGRSKNFLVALDSRYETVDEHIKLKVTQADFTARLIKLEGNNYYKTLRQKLNWGLDVRN